ncbi:MAG: MFS transporter [Candidatus Krumholzibacteriota bacterium]|nr:MFS transporter [Candidatus Krumholzibacteriota bacterium]
MTEDRPRGNLGKVLAVSLAHLVHDTPSAFLAPVLPLLIDRFGLTVFMAGLLDVVRRIPALANPFLGLVADRICIRWFIIIAPGLTAVAMSFLGLAPAYAVLVILLLVAGVSSAVFHVTAPVMMRHVSTGRIGRGMSFYMLGGELARTLGPLAILGAVSLWGLEGSWRLAPVGAAASGMLWYALRDVSMAPKRLAKTDDGAKETLRRLAPFFVSVTGIFLCRAAMKSALTIYLPTYLTSRGASLWIAGISLAVLQFSGAAGTFLAGIVSDRIGRKRTLLAISAVNPFLMWLFIVVDGRFAIPVLVVTGFFVFASGPVLLALVHDIDSKRMSLINGVYMTLNFMLTSLTVLAVGFAADRIGLEPTFRLSAVVAAGSVPFVLFLKPGNAGRRGKGGPVSGA